MGFEFSIVKSPVGWYGYSSPSSRRRPFILLPWCGTRTRRDGCGSPPSSQTTSSGNAGCPVFTGEMDNLRQCTSDGDHHHKKCSPRHRRRHAPHCHAVGRRRGEGRPRPHRLSAITRRRRRLPLPPLPPPSRRRRPSRPPFKRALFLVGRKVFSLPMERCCGSRHSGMMWSSRRGRKSC